MTRILGDIRARPSAELDNRYPDTTALGMWVTRSTLPERSSVIAMRSIRQIGSPRSGWEDRYQLPVARSRLLLLADTPSSARPAASPRRVFTSTNTSSVPSRITRSISPDEQCQLLSIQIWPFDSR